MKDIEIFAFEGEGIEEVYNNGKYLISIKNWRAANDVENIARLEIHHTTDEQFMLISGKAVILHSADPDGEVQVTALEVGKVLNLPQGMWFNNVLSKDCKLMYTEFSDAGDPGNSEYHMMSEEQKEAVKAKIRAAMA